MKKLLAAILVLLTAEAQADHPVNVGGAVSLDFVCRSEIMPGLVEGLTHSREAANALAPILFSQGFCVSVAPQTVAVAKILSGPHTDFDGDMFFVVEVEDGVATIAWSHLNYVAYGRAT